MLVYFVCRRCLELETHYNLHNLQNHPWEQILVQRATVLLAASLLWSQTPIERAVIWCENAGSSKFLWVENWYAWDRLTFASRVSVLSMESIKAQNPTTKIVGTSSACCSCSLYWCGDPQAEQIKDRDSVFAIRDVAQWHDIHWHTTNFGCKAIWFWTRRRVCPASGCWGVPEQMPKFSWGVL